MIKHLSIPYPFRVNGMSFTLFSCIFVDQRASALLFTTKLSAALSSSIYWMPTIVLDVVRTKYIGVVKIAAINLSLVKMLSHFLKYTCGRLLDTMRLCQDSRNHL